MAGRSAFTVRLFLDGQDTVTVEDSVDLEVPRRDGAFTHNPMTADLVVPASDGTTYAAPVLQTYGQGSWESRVPWEKEPG